MTQSWNEQIAQIYHKTKWELSQDNYTITRGKKYSAETPYPGVPRRESRGTANARKIPVVPLELRPIFLPECTPARSR